jgi:hypothetical protein
LAGLESAQGLKFLLKGVNFMIRQRRTAEKTPRHSYQKESSTAVDSLTMNNDSAGVPVPPVPGSRGRRWEDIEPLTIQEFKSLDKRAKQGLCLALEIEQGDSGNATPFENFHTTLQILWFVGRTTPSELREAFDEFEGNFITMVENVMEFGRTYGHRLDLANLDKAFPAQAEVPPGRSAVKNEKRK